MEIESPVKCSSGDGGSEWLLEHRGRNDVDGKNWLELNPLHLSAGLN